MIPAVLLALRTALAGSDSHLISALILLFGLFSVLDVDGPSFLGMSTGTGIAIEAPEDEIKHPGLDHRLQVPPPEAHRSWRGIRAVSAQRAHPVTTWPVVPPCARTS